MAHMSLTTRDSIFKNLSAWKSKETYMSMEGKKKKKSIIASGHGALGEANRWRNSLINIWQLTIEVKKANF